ncbi:MAG: universal stress protein [Magnetococcales bacterium]|nr:universal stress protein [Magnetococcales bacterium]
MKILIHLDGSPLCWQALRAGATLARRGGFPLTVMTIRPGTLAEEAPPPFGAEVPREDWDRLPPGLVLLTHAIPFLEDCGVVNERVTALRLREGEEDCWFFHLGRPDGGTVVLRVDFGPLLSTLLERFDPHDPEQLLVLSDPGRRGLHRLLTGNLAHRVALRGYVSVLVVKGVAAVDQRVILCLDGSPASRRAWPFLEALLPVLGPRVDVLGVRVVRGGRLLQDPCEPCARQARDRLRATGKTSDAIIRQGPEAGQAIREEAGAGALVVMGDSSRGDLERLWAGSVPLDVLEQGHASLLLVKMPPGAGASPPVQDGIRWD